MNPAKHRRTLLALTALAIGGLPLAAQTVTTTLLNDTFSDNERATQSLPGSAKWLSSSSSGLSVSSGALAQGTTTNGNGATNLAYFTASDSPASLAVDESLKLTFDVNFVTTSNSAGGFRVGLFDSGTRVTADGFGNTNAAFTGSYAGYIGGVNLAATSNNILRFYERGTSTNLIGGSVSSFVQLGTSGGGVFKTFAAGSTYTATYTLTRTNDQEISVTLSYTGLFAGDSVVSTQTATRLDSSGLTTSFDTLAFYNYTGNAYTLDNIKLDYTHFSAIPEPSTVALIFGGTALLAGVIIRRRRAAA